MPDSFVVAGRIAQRWEWWGAAGGPFGRPVGPEETVPGHSGVRQRFERGEIGWSPDQNLLTSVYLLRNEACLEWSRPGVDFDAFRYDVALDGVSQGHNVFSISFDEDMHPEDELFIWTRLQGFGEYAFVVESLDGDDGNGWSVPVRLTFGRLGDSPFPDDPPVVGRIADRWHELGAWDGPLGRPVEPMGFDVEAQGLRQHFKNGFIQTVPAQGAHMVVAGYQRLLPPDDSREFAHPSLELTWGGSDTAFTHFRVDYLLQGELTTGVPWTPSLGEWAHTGAGSGQYQLRAPKHGDEPRATYVFKVYGTVAPPLSEVFGGLTFPDEPTFRIALDLVFPARPDRIPVELPALDGSPAAAYASQCDRAMSVARAFAATRPLRVTFRLPFKHDAPPSGENDGVRLMAHFAAAAEEPDFCARGELPSLVLAHIALRQMRVGPVGTRTEGGIPQFFHYHREGDYDTALRGLLVIAYRYGHLLTEPEMDFILHRLVPPGLSGGHPLTAETVNIDVEVFDELDPLLNALVDTLTSNVPESENHILMIESARYLVNQLLLDRTGDQRYDNRHNGLTDWLLGYLQTIAKHDFLEFNARAYTRYSVHALLNLHEFARDEEVRTLVQNILDYATVRFAVSSNRLRRVNPYRRLDNARNRSEAGFDDLFSQKTDPMTGFFLTWVGDRDRRGNPLDSFPEWWSFWAVLAGQAAYRPPPQAYSLAMTAYPPVQHTLYHGARPPPTMSHDLPDGGVEIYYKSPSFLLSAGGMFLNSGYGSDQFHSHDQAVPQATTLIPTFADPKFPELIRFDPFPDRSGVNIGVHMGFACGANLQIPDIWYTLTDSAAQGAWTFLDLNTNLGKLHPNDPFEAPLGPLGFYLAAYRTPPAQTDALDDLDDPPQFLGMLYAMEAGPSTNPVMSFKDFKDITQDRNHHLPTQLEYGNTYEFNTADGHTFTTRLSTTGNKYHARVLRMDDADLLHDLTLAPLVSGRYLTAPGHDGLVTVTSPDCDMPLRLDSRDKQHPTRTDTATACAQLHLDRARALIAVATTHNVASATFSNPDLVVSQGWLRSIRRARAAVSVLRGFDPPAAAAVRYRALIASSLGDLIFRLKSARRFEEIPKLCAETIVAYRQAAKVEGADTVILGSLLMTLSAWMSEIPLPDRAVEAAKAATEVFDTAVPPTSEDQAVFLRTAAFAVFTLVFRLITAGRLDEIPPAADHAVTAYRAAAAAPGADRQQLRLELETLSVHLSAAGLAEPAAAVAAAAAGL